MQMQTENLLKPDANCFCNVCEHLRDIERQEALANTLNNWRDNQVQPGETLLFGKAAR